MSISWVSTAMSCLPMDKLFTFGSGLFMSKSRLTSSAFMFLVRLWVSRSLVFWLPVSQLFIIILKPGTDWCWLSVCLLIVCYEYCNWTLSRHCLNLIQTLYVQIVYKSHYRYLLIVIAMSFCYTTSYYPWVDPECPWIAIWPCWHPECLDLSSNSPWLEPCLPLVLDQDCSWLHSDWPQVEAV